MSIYCGKTIYVGNNVYENTSFNTRLSDINKAKEEIKFLSTQNPDTLVSAYIYVEGSTTYELYSKNGNILSTLEASVEYIKDKTELPISIRTNEYGRTFLDIETGRGFVSSVDVDLETDKAKKVWTNEIGDANVPFIGALTKTLERAVELSISERDRSRRYVAGEKVTFGTYTPPEVENKEPVIIVDDYEEDRSF